MHGARAAAPGPRAAKAVQMPQVSQDLLHGDLAAQRGEVDPRGPFGRTAGLTAVARLLELLVTGGKDLQLTPGQFVGGREVAQRAVKPDLVVVFHVEGHHPTGVLQRRT